MKDKTLLPGKDLALEDTVSKATSLLKTMDLITEAISQLNPTPNCWSVHIQSTTCKHLYTNGKGTSQLASLASGLSEFFERLSTNLFFADYFLGEEHRDQPFCFYPDEKWFPLTRGDEIPSHNQQGIELLTEDLRTFYNPDEQLSFSHLCDNNIDSPQKAISALPFQCLSNNKTVYFPVSILNNLYVSNGMAAGNSEAECCAQALSEIIERYVKNLIITKGISLPDVPRSHLENYPKICSIIDTLANQGLSVRVKDGSLGGQFPVICVLVAEKESGGVFAAFGANLRFEVAVERTLTELLQGRNLDQFHDFQPPCHDLEQVADPFNLESHFIDSDGLLSWNMFRDAADFDYTPWDFCGSTTDEFDKLQAVIHDNGFQVYRAEYSHCGMYCCRIIVPGMSEIYPVDDLIWNNKGTGARLRPFLLQLPDLSRKKLLELFELLETLGLSDQQLISHTIGVLFEETSYWASLRIGELKALTLLVLKQKEEALFWCTWCLDHGSLPHKRKRFYRLLQSQLNFHLSGENPDNFKESLKYFYEEHELNEAQSVVAGIVKFPGLHFGRNWTDISSEHKNLLDIYRRINRLKMDQLV